ncbi:MAG: nucleotide exchange factor GrpE [Clostridia bacterium]|jgi:molecular chaperone GrpE|nr:nucleotide exchange factor GrpE [Clostridia bacterium]
MNAKKHHVEREDIRETTPEEMDEIVDKILDEAGLDDAPPEKPQGDSKDMQLKEANDRVVRLMADFDNYRKRIQREKEDWTRYGAMNLMEKLLPVLDNLERALENVQNQGEEVKGIFSGVVMIQRQLLDVLQNEGLSSVEDLGKSFDPTLHEAVMSEPAQYGEADNEITGVLRKGYLFRDKLLRAAMVKVAKK